ncbi:hypothetical protein [Enhygromyxa salina]|uniref:Uncharacterized protein n=1 Tax=Enhygromyxa salina TaxID=215803 RepID=A0A2S9YRK4_9BACT|nr:hypothetical protein [Enhygromyxa salina]PRQ07716.1 hypothetical protein ENSA7_27060 [Enhygromyxa salina]
MNNPYGNLNQGSGNGQPGYPQPTPQYAQPGYSYPPPPRQAPPPHYEQPGYVSYGQGAAPPNAYHPAPGVHQANELSKLADDSQLWLMVAAGGFWFGFGFITGPLGWYFGSQIRGKYRALGHHPCSSANWAWGIGIATTLITYLGIMFVAGLLMMALGFLAV